MKTYQSEIFRIENLYDQGDTKNTVSECGILIEHVVQMIFLDFHNHLTTPEERKTYLDLEIKWGTDYSSFIRRPTIGVSLRYYNQLLNALNPANVLDRGYAIVRDEKDKVIPSKAKAKNKSNIKITFKDGDSHALLQK